jgi:hypothetical protein
MVPVYMDWETFWSVEHSLSKMNPIDYVMHPETEIQSLSIAVGDWPIDVLFGEERIRNALAKLDWSDKYVIAHNGSGFDHLISAWRFGIRPKAWGCTLAMAKPFLGLTVGGSLKKVSEHLGLPPKGSLEEVNTKGKKLKDFTPDEIVKMTNYNKHDTYLCREIFKHYAPLLGLKELKLIDATIRMTVEPELEADIPLLESALADEINRKNQSLLKLATMTGVHQPNMTADAAVSAMRDIVMSQPQFANLLTQIGAEVPMKESPTAVDEHGNPKMIPALAKTDQGMTDLLEYEDPDGDHDKEELVRVAAGTRLEVKSTQLETRIRTYLLVANRLGGKLPAPLNYCGATITWRMSGGMKMNMQNNPRVDPKRPAPADVLRKSIRAPRGKKIVVVDSSNIELRVAHGLAGQWDTVDKLRNKEDLYCWFASTLFGRVVTKQDEIERFIGKQAMLSLQYGASWKSFQRMVRIQSAKIGKPMLLSDDECKRIVKVWRGMFKAITDRDVGIWAKCDKAIEAMFLGQHMVVDAVGLCHTTHERIITPEGHWLQYPDLRKVMKPNGKEEWKYGQKQHASRIYGAHTFENICQHIARLVVMEQTMLVAKKYPIKLSCHDEAVTLAFEDDAENCERYVQQCFATPPKWWPDLPLASEAGSGYTYAEAK